MTTKLLNSRRYLVKVVCLFVICCVFFAANVIAQTVREDEPGPTKEADDSPKNITAGSPHWFPFFAPPDKFDWIQLTSGEWLKGEFKVLYDDKLEFDSDELDLLELDWEDVKEVQGHGRHSVRFEGPITVVGMLKVIDN